MTYGAMHADISLFKHIHRYTDKIILLLNRRSYHRIYMWPFVGASATDIVWVMGLPWCGVKLSPSGAAELSVMYRWIDSRSHYIIGLFESYYGSIIFSEYITNLDSVSCTKNFCWTAEILLI